MELTQTVKDVIKLNPNAKYLFVVKEKTVTVQALESIKKHLESNGINAIIIAGNFDIYEIEKS